MNKFFRTIKELSPDKACRIAVGIDGVLAGQKAVLSEREIIYKTDLFPTEILSTILVSDFHGEDIPKAGRPWNPGLYRTPAGRIFLEVSGARKKLILCGGGHVSSAVLSIAKMMEFHSTVVEDRLDFAGQARQNGADEVICENFTEGLSRVETDSDTYVVVMTRGHRHDLECLRQMMGREYAYLGLMGSSSRVTRIRRMLLEEGFSREKIDSIHGPVGLPIQAATPAEIAVSVLAQIIQEKNQGGRQVCYEKEIASWLFSEEDREPAVLATIIARKGSAPRQAGTKMLIFADGSSLGTIGGGCMEAEVKGKARHLLAETRGFLGSAGAVGKLCTTCFVDMTGAEAAEEGMVCGGTMEIFLEVL